MKKLICALLALVLVFGLAGCQFLQDVADVLLETEPEESVSLTDTTPEPTVAPDPATTPEPTTTPKPATTPQPTTTPEPTEAPLDPDGYYYSKEDVALYIHTYGRLPDNFMTKREAQSLGWSGGSLEQYAPGAAIGGDRFGNYEGLLPTKKGRVYTECDIDTKGKSSRGAKRIVFSNDGLIYYTGDHYESFTLLYGEES